MQGQDYRYSDYRLNYSGSQLGDESIANIDTWLERHDLDPGVMAVLHFYRGLHYRELKKYKFAITDFTDAIGIEPDFASAYFFRAQCYLNEKNIEKAVSDFTRAIKNDPRHYESFVNRGNCYVRLNLPDSAIRDYTTAIGMHAVSPESTTGGACAT